jgi:hypothetical protein
MPSKNIIRRTHEYFVSREGIDRAVITADIRRYLGPDALVRPGSYEVSILTSFINEGELIMSQRPETKQMCHGYFITAYRNLTPVLQIEYYEQTRR